MNVVRLVGGVGAARNVVQVAKARARGDRRSSESLYFHLVPEVLQDPGNSF